MINHHASPLEKILDAAGSYKSEGGGFRMNCPAHGGDGGRTLSVKEGDDGAAIVHCHKGCETEDVVEALGLTMKDLFPDDEGPGHVVGKKVGRAKAAKSVTTEGTQTIKTEDLPDGTYFDFRDASGEVLYLQKHKGPYYRKVGEDRWALGLEGVEMVLYNLDGLTAGVTGGETVFHVEGCKDAETAIETLAVVATTSGGSKTWRKRFAKHYTDASVVIVPDNDEEGRRYAKEVAEDLLGVADTVRILNLPGLGEKGDLTDWLEAGHTKEEFESLVDGRPALSPKAFAIGDANDANDTVFQRQRKIFEALRELPEAKPFPVEVLPSSIGRFAKEAAAGIGCPVDYLALSALLAVSAAIGDTREVGIKKNWNEGASLYAMIVGPPASKKTPAMNVALRPVYDRQRSLKQEHSRRMEEYKEAVSEYKRAKKEGQTELSEPQKPTLERTYADDTTVERLAGILNENRRGILISRDELSGWLGSMNQYKGGRGADRQFWLQADNNRPLTVDRKGDEDSIIVPRPWISVLGGIQPDVLPDFGEGRGDGLMARFLAVYPEPKRTRWSKDEVSDEAEAAYLSVLGKLYRLEQAAYDGQAFPARLRMTADAEELFAEAYDGLQEEAESPGFPRRLSDTWGKLEGRLARLALIVAMVRIADTDAPTEEIIKSDMFRAVVLLGYFKNHIRRVYTGLYGENPLDLLAADLKNFLVENGGSWEGTASELHEVLDSDFRPERPDELSKAARAIARRSPGIRVEEKRSGKRRAFRLSLEVC